MKAVRHFLKLSRPKHWLKNILIFIPLFYAQSLFNMEMLMPAIISFIAFCLISSAVYVFNDIVDAEKDRLHPAKLSRPIASGQIGIGQAAVFASILCIGGFLIIFAGVGIGFILFFATIYTLLNLAYTLRLKQLAIVDCFCIAAGFVLRVLVGGASYGGGISDWLFLTVVTVSLFMAFGKRRGEIANIDDTKSTREVLSHYNINFLNGMIFVCAGLSVVFYSLWAMANDLLIYTVPLVIFIICKYLLVALNDVTHGDPTTIILDDKGLMVAVGIFGLLSSLLLYL